MSNRNSLKGLTGITRVRNAIKYSWAGYKAAWSDEEAFRQILVLAAIGIPSALFIGDGFAEKMLLILPCILCILVELLNSAIENTVDRISLEHHELAKKAKDMGSAAQFSAQIFLGFTWLIYGICKLIQK